MRINHNVAALNTSRQLATNTFETNKSIEKLSSGLRINRAGDDAAGLSISEKMRGQIRGLAQAQRNIQDGISLIQTSEGALTEVHSILQRSRELAVQAGNDTNTNEDKQNIQNEIDQLRNEVDKIANYTEFNTIKLLNKPASTGTAILDNLQKGWLAASEKLVQDTFGIGGKNSNFSIILDTTIDGPGNTLAMVQYSFTPGVPGPGGNLQLHLDMADFTNSTYPNGGGFIANDRIIAHEMTHAAMAASINISTGMHSWFMEGTAEAVQGADERLSFSMGGMTSQQLADRIGTGSSAWGGTSDDYSMGYAAVRYLDYLISNNGGSGVKDIITNMASNTTLELEDAINANVQLNGLGINTLADFATQFRSAAAGGGVHYINTVLIPALANSDTGSILGSDRASSIGGGAAVKNNSDVVDESGYGTITSDPLTSYVEIWPSNTTADSIHIQVGANSDQHMDIQSTDVRSSSLGISAADVITNAGAAITIFDSAIKNVSMFRSSLGALQNRLEHSLLIAHNSEENLTAAESRIRDVDMAKEMMSQTKSNILAQAAQAMLAQANQQPQGVLQLLR
ncbi:flagellinolysin [Paenibacillus wynnii]|uniref:Flagellin n=1 Tax=Paenibacillus wynnii TaxID=268407 RepID=A0A098MCW6_9BACL|nr:flagellinolysin [Paenibacillus wynnii]KGE20414.1 hypothetical protein PWYN_14485 [Paenibacillus wynnii]